MLLLLLWKADDFGLKVVVCGLLLRQDDEWKISLHKN
jgi:hypothetical protein